MKRKVFVVMLIVLFMLVGGAAVFSRQSKPGQVLEKGITHLVNTNSLSYTLTQEQTVDGEKRLLSKINGIKGGENVHIQGQLAGTAIEMMKVDGALYNKDPYSGEWVKFTDLSVVREVFLVELDPLAVMQLKEIGEVKLQEKKEWNGKKCSVYVVKPSVQNDMMERFWTDFTYQFTIGRSDQKIYATEITGIQKETGNPVSIVLEFKDYDKAFNIQAPETTKN